jgi:hypothetical protein
MSQPDWTVEFESRGRAGNIHYTEGSNVITFYYEFGGTVVAIIWPPEKQVWDRKFPWAVGRRNEIIERVIQETLRQQAPGCIAEEDEQGNAINIKYSLS